MVMIHNNSIFTRVRRIFNSKTGEEISPDTADFIQPVIEINKPIQTKTYSAQVAVTGNSTILTTETDRDFYITGAYFQFSCDNAVTDATQIGIVFYPYDNGSVATGFLISDIITTGVAVASKSQFMNFSTPIKVARGTAIYISGAYAAGTMRRYANIFGYYDDTTN